MPKKKRSVKIPILIFVLILAAAGVWLFLKQIPGKQSPGKQYAEGFDTPQEALDFFVEAVSRLDYEKALTAFPIERAAENYSFDKWINRVQTWAPSFSMMSVPSSSDGNTLLNQHMLAVQREDEINKFVFSFFADAELRTGMFVQGEDEVRRLFEDYNVEDIRMLEAVQMTFADEEHQKKDGWRKNVKKLAKCYGGDTLEDYMITYRIGGNTYIGGVEFIKYGGKYYIWSLRSSFIDTGSGFGFVMPEDEYKAQAADAVSSEEMSMEETPTEDTSTDSPADDEPAAIPADEAPAREE